MRKGNFPDAFPFKHRQRYSSYFVLEYFGIGNLDQVTQKVPFQKKDLLELIVQVSLALISLRRQGIVHKDIKPDNILLGLQKNSLHFKVIDLGVSEQISPEGEVKASGVCGCMGFMAPEVTNKL